MSPVALDPYQQLQVKGFKESFLQKDEIRKELRKQRDEFLDRESSMVLQDNNRVNLLKKKQEKLQKKYKKLKQAR